uniref:Uncharacterized protein n=1 Tax=Cucumis melo TaxID=3656 RepID=A0A9I9E794_CUCME
MDIELPQRKDHCDEYFIIDIPITDPRLIPFARAEADLSKKLLITIIIIIIVIIITNRRGEALPLSLIFSALPFPPNALSVSSFKFN